MQVGTLIGIMALPGEDWKSFASASASVNSSPAKTDSTASTAAPQSAPTHDQHHDHL
jgi:hypothetical protein